MQRKLPWLFVTQWYSLKSFQNYWFVGSRQAIPEDITGLLAKFERRALMDASEFKVLASYFKLRLDNIEHPVRVVYDTIFEDDTVEDALTKIAQAIGADMSSAYPLPCAWTMDDEPLAFELSNNGWKGWHANPLLSNFTQTSPGLAKQPAKQSKMMNVVYPHTFLNVLSYENYPDKAYAEYHFVNAKDLRTTDILKHLKTDTEQLTKVWLDAASSATAAAAAAAGFDGCEVSEWTCEASVPPSLKATLVLSEVFDRITTSKVVPLVQWYDDAQHIVYKVHEQHTLPEEMLSKWTQSAPMASGPTIIVYSALVFTKKDSWSSYVRTTISAAGKVQISCKISKQFSWQQIIETYSWLKQLVMQWLGENIPNLKFRETVVSIQTPHISPALNGRLAQLFNFLSRYSNILITPKYEKRPERAIFAFARSTRRQNVDDLIAFIESQMALGVQQSDMIINIAEREQLSLQEARELFENTLEDMKASTMANLAGAPAGRRAWNQRQVQERLTTQIELTPYQTSGVLVKIINALDRHEATRILIWLRGLFAAFGAREQTPAPAPVPVPAPAPAAASSAAKEASKSKSKSPTATAGLQDQGSRASSADAADDYGDDAMDDAMDELVGGGGSPASAAARDDMEFLKPLQAMDPNLFQNSTTYARKCQKTGMRQPVVVTPAQKEYIDKNGYANSYPSALRYGSDRDRQNFYMCPSIWCPVSKVPLTQEQYQANLANKTKGCPDPNEQPWLIGKYRSTDDPYHVNLQVVDGNDLCLPCCGKRSGTAQDKKIKECMRRVEPSMSASRKSPVAPQQQQPRSGPSQPSAAKPSAAQPSAQSPDDNGKEMDNLLKVAPPLEKGRYGDVPELLYDAMQLRHMDQYQACPKNTSIKKNKQCFVRFGLASPLSSDKSDSFMNALTYLLMGEKAKKQDLVKHIGKSLDPMTFMTLENGLVFLSFLDAEPLIPTDPQNKGLVARLAKWLTDPNHKTYVKLFGLTNLVSALASASHADIAQWSQPLQYELSRQLAIFKAFANFMVHLRWDEPKNTYLMNDLLRLFRTRLVIWEKHTNAGGQTSLYMRCPLYTYHDEIDQTLRLSYDYVMMLYEKGEYDPIELKSKGAPGITKFKADSFPALREMSMQCIRYDNAKDPAQKAPKPLNYSEPRPIETFRLLKQSMAMISADASLQIDTIVLEDNMSILGFLTKNGIYIKAPPLHFGALPALLKVMDIEKIRYHSDLPSDHIVEMHRVMWNVFADRLKKMRYECPVTEVVSSGGKADPMKIRLQPNIPPVVSAPAIPVRIATGDPLYQYQTDDIKRTQKWVRIQRKIAAAMVEHYDTWVAPIYAVSEARRAKPMNALREHLKKVLKVSQLPSEARVLLEEMPLHDKSALEAFKRTSGMQSKYPFMDFEVKRDKSQGNQWVFSQLAVLRGLPDEVVRPVQGFRPRTNYMQNETAVTTTAQRPMSDIPTANILRRIALPSMAKMGSGHNTAEDLPSRWTSHANANAAWKDMKRLAPSGDFYNKESLLDLLAYVGESVSIPVARTQLEVSTTAWVQKQLLMAPAAYVDKLMASKAVTHAWRQAYLAHVKDGAKEEDDRGMLKWIGNAPNDKSVIDLWNKVVAPALWPNDEHLFTAAKLLQIHILVIDARAHDKKTSDVKRGTTADQARVSRLFYDTELAKRRPKEAGERPLLMLYREANKLASASQGARGPHAAVYYDEYQLITYKKDLFFNHLSEAPMDVQHLVSYVRNPTGA